MDHVHAGWRGEDGVEQRRTGTGGARDWVSEKDPGEPSFRPFAGQAARNEVYEVKSAQ